MSEDTAPNEWPLRPWLLAGLLGAAGLLIHLVTGDSDDVPWQVAVGAFLFFGAIAAAFTLENGRWKEPAIFAAVVGLVMAGLAWRAAPADQYLPDEQYGFAAGVVATALALPLFQAEFWRTRLKTPYPEIYHHVWTDAISAAGALAFTGISWLVLALMANLFNLLKFDFLLNAMDEGWFGWTFSGLAAGAALGTIRNQLKILATMQTVVLLVASLLAVPLAVGLVVFLLATAVSGPQVLWDATRSATPLLLACAAGSFVLANAIARQDDEAMSRNRVMRIAGWALAGVILPLAVFAAVSMGLRLNQYGLSPERLWGLVAIVVAVACGAIYWLALIRGRKAGWAAKVRTSTFHFGLFVCGLAIVLALPIVSFSGISASNQLARLESGAVSADEFDFAALRWDFGDAGRRALRRLQRSGNARIAELANAAMGQTERPYDVFQPPEERFVGAFEVHPTGSSLPDALRTAITSGWDSACKGEALCRVYLEPDGQTAVVVSDGCAAPKMTREQQVEPGIECNIDVTAWVFDETQWEPANHNRPEPDISEEDERESLRRERAAIDNGEVRVAPSRLRQVYVGDKPVGRPFE